VLHEHFSGLAAEFMPISLHLFGSFASLTGSRKIAARS